MQGRFKLRKQIKSAPKSRTLHPLKTQRMTKAVPPKNNKVQKPSMKKIQSEYYHLGSKTSIPPKSPRVDQKKFLKRHTAGATSERSQHLSMKVLNQLTGKINVLQDNLNTRNKKILNLKLDKAFLDIQILNNQAQLHKAEKQEKGSYALQTIYNLSKQIQDMKTAIANVNENHDNLLNYQRFLIQALNEGSSQSQLRCQLSEYSSKQKISTQFLNAIQQLRMVQLSVDKHNQIYQPYINKLKKDIASQRQAIVSKQKEIKRVNQVIFTHYGKKIRRNKSETSSNYSRASSARRRNEIQVFYCGNLIAKNRSTMVTDKRLLEKVDVTFSGLKIGFHPQEGFVFQCLYTDDRGEVCEGQLHSPNQLQTTDTEMSVNHINNVTKVAVEFNKKVNTIEFTFKDGTSRMFGTSHPHLQRKQLDIKDKVVRCMNTHWSEGILVGIGLQYQKRKQLEGSSVAYQYFG